MSVDPVTCHILDTNRGKPAAGVTCSIYYLGPNVSEKSNEKCYDIGASEPFGLCKTDADGRVKRWVFNPSANDEAFGIAAAKKWENLVPGIYKIKFLTGKYFHELSDTSRTFFPFVEIVFVVEDPPDAHYHVPLLLSNHSYTTYRGS